MSRASGAPAASGEGGEEETEGRVQEADGDDGDDVARRACSSLPPDLEAGPDCPPPPPPPLLRRGASVVVVVVRVEAQGEEREKALHDGGQIS